MRRILPKRWAAVRSPYARETDFLGDELKNKGKLGNMPSVGECIPAERRRAFTLIELMVSISIIAVLLSLLLSGLRSVRETARSAKCLSNQGQLAVGWTMYLNDHKDRFPFNPGPTGSHSPHHMFDWGGVDWISDSILSPIIGPFRPINPYVGDGLQEKARAEIFLCPSDNHIEYFSADENPYYAQYGTPPYQVEEEVSHAEDVGESLYSTIGTSYRANDWIWARVGSIRGQKRPPDLPEGEPNPNIVLNNSQLFVTQPSRFTLIGDYAQYLFGRMDRDFAQVYDPVYGNWHGEYVCNMAFLDGSARRERMEPGKGTTSSYTFYLDPVQHQPYSWVYIWGDDTMQDWYPDEEATTE